MNLLWNPNDQLHNSFDESNLFLATFYLVEKIENALVVVQNKVFHCTLVLLEAL